MNTYEVCVKREGWTRLDATDFREDKKAGLYNFYIDNELVAFFRISEVAGLKVHVGNAPDSGLEIRARVKEMLKVAECKPKPRKKIRKNE